MAYDLVLALTLFAVVSSITPGPNNLMLLASGANFGFRRSIPHMLGIAAGFIILIILVGLGLAGIFARWPQTHTALKIVSVLYLVWLAWKIANAAPVKETRTETRPMTFLQAALFQWVNPKGWSMALTAVTVYAPDNTLFAIVLVAGIFGAINLPAVSSWTLLGQQMARFLTNKLRLRAFNWTMAALLILSLYPVLWP